MPAHAPRAHHALSRDRLPRARRRRSSCTSCGTATSLRCTACAWPARWASCSWCGRARCGAVGGRDTRGAHGHVRTRGCVGTAAAAQLAAVHAARHLAARDCPVPAAGARRGARPALGAAGGQVWQQRAPLRLVRRGRAGRGSGACLGRACTAAGPASYARLACPSEPARRLASPAPEPPQVRARAQRGLRPLPRPQLPARPRRGAPGHQVVQRAADGHRHRQAGG